MERYFVIIFDDDCVKDIREFKTLSQARNFYSDKYKIDKVFAFKVNENGMEEILRISSK